MSLLSNAVRAVLTRLCVGLPCRRIRAPDGGLLVEQFLLSHSPERTAWRLRLHHYVRGDADRALHNHPWWGLSLILVGGYREEYRDADHDPLGADTYTVRMRVLTPLSVNFITPETFHRIDLRERDAWTLFLSSPARGSWGFWDRATNTYEDNVAFGERIGVPSEKFGAQPAAGQT